MARRKTVTLAQGCYQLANGKVFVVARIGSGARLRTSETIWFPPVDRDGIPYSKKNNGELIKCYLQLVAALRDTRARDGSAAGSVGAAIDAFLVAYPIVKGTPTKHDDWHYALQHWRRAPIAAADVDTVKRSAIRAQLDAWTAAGVPGSTVNKRRVALAHVVRHALGAADQDVDVILPTDRIPKAAEPGAQIRGIDLPIVARILANVPDYGRPIKGGGRVPYSETRIRLVLLAWTGLSAKSLQRVERRHVNFRTGKLWQPDRRKGAGAAGVFTDLLPPAIDAFRAFDRAGLWGRRWANSGIVTTWRRAVAATRAELERAGDPVMLEQFLAAIPPDTTPYDLRHSFATDLYRRTKDLGAVQEILQHASIETTKRYTMGAVSERTAAAIDAMRAQWFPDAPKPAGVVRAFTVIDKTGA
jgi:integrase